MGRVTDGRRNIITAGEQELTAERIDKISELGRKDGLRHARTGKTETRVNLVRKLLFDIGYPCGIEAYRIYTNAYYAVRTQETR